MEEEELAERQGEGLADTISGIAGVTTLRSTTGMAKPVIRGQVGRRNLILFDGIRHEGQKWGIDHAPEIDPYAASRITVIKGATTTRFGPDAIGGVVLVDPPPLLRRPGIAGQLSTVGFSNPLGGGGAARLDGAHRAAPGLAWRIEGNWSRHRAALAPDYPLDNTGSRTWNLGARLGYLSDRFDVVAAYRHLDLTAGICSCLRISTPSEFSRGLIGAQPPNADLYSPELRIERPRQEVTHDLALATSRIDLDRGGELHATYAYQRNARDEFDTVRGDVDGAQLSFDLGTHTGVVHYHQPPVDLGQTWDLYGVVDVDASRQNNEFESASTLVPDYDQWSWGAAAVERVVGQRIEVEFGGRYDGLTRTAKLTERDFLGLRAGGRLDDDQCNRFDQGAACQRVFHTGSVSAGVHGEPLVLAPEFSLRLHLSSSARMPAIDEQYMNGAAPSFPILGLGDFGLGVERTWGATATAVYAGEHLHVEGSGYFNYIDDYIYFAAAPQTGDCAPLNCTTRGPLPVFEFNPIDATFAGGEAQASYRLPRLPFQVSGDASWLRARNLTDDNFVSFVPADRYRLSGRWLISDGSVTENAYLGLETTFVARQRRYDPQTDFADPPPGYVLLGASAGVEFPAGLTRLRVSARGANLLNQRFRDYTSLLRYFADEPGWSAQLRFAVDFHVEPGSPRKRRSHRRGSAGLTS